MKISFFETRTGILFYQSRVSRREREIENDFSGSSGKKLSWFSREFPGTGIPVTLCHLQHHVATSVFDVLYYFYILLLYYSYILFLYITLIYYSFILLLCITLVYHSYILLLYITLTYYSYITLVYYPYITLLYYSYILQSWYLAQPAVV